MPGFRQTKADEERFQAEDDLRTLLAAEKIRKSKPRLTRAMKMAKEQADALDKVKSSA